MASLIFNLNDYKRNILRSPFWGEYDHPEDSEDCLFRPHRLNFRYCHVLEGHRQQKQEDYFLPKPLSYDFRHHITSPHNTKRNIKPHQYNYQVFPHHDYDRKDDNGEYAISENSRKALKQKHDELYRTHRYPTVFPDQSAYIKSHPDKPPPQHHHYKKINKMLKSNHFWNYHIVLPPFKHAEPIPVSPEQTSRPRFLTTENLRSSSDLEPVDRIQITQNTRRNNKRPSRWKEVRFSVPEVKSPSEPIKGDQSQPILTTSPRNDNCFMISSCEKVGGDEGDLTRYKDKFGCSHMDMIRRRRKMENLEDEEEGEEEDIVNEEDCEVEKHERPIGCYCTKDPNTCKLVHKCGKFVSPYSTDRTPNYLCSKTESCKRYQAMFPDSVPDQRENFTYGKRVTFYGMNSSAFR